MYKRSWAQHTFPNFLISGTRYMFHSINVKILSYPQIPVCIAAPSNCYEKTNCLCTGTCIVASVMSDSVAPWTVTHEAPLSTEFSRQEYWSGLPFPSPRYLLHPGIQPASPAYPGLAGGFFTTGPLGKPKPPLIFPIFVTIYF